MNFLKVMTMTLWFAMSMATKNYSVHDEIFYSEDENRDNSLSSITTVDKDYSFLESCEKPTRKESEKFLDFDKIYFHDLQKALYNDAQETKKSSSTGELHPNLWVNDQRDLLEGTASIIEQEQNSEIHNDQEQGPKNIDQTGCPLCEMDVTEDNCVMCDSCGEFQKAGDKVMGNNACRCHGRCGNHHCASCSKKNWGIDLNKGEKIIGERPAGKTYVQPLYNDGDVNVSLKYMVPEKCAECHHDKHSLKGDTMYIKENKDAICDHCHVKKQAREQQGGKKDIPTKIVENHGKPPKINSFTQKTERPAEKGEEETFWQKITKNRTVFLIINVLALVLVIGSIACCCTTKPKTEIAKTSRRHQIQELRSQTGRIHVIHV